MKPPWSPLAARGALVAVAALIAAGGCTGGGGGQPPPLPGLGVARNGEEQRSPREVLDDARAALLDVPSVQVVGDLTLAGRALRVDLVLTRAGALSGLLEGGGERVQVVRVPADATGRVLVRGSAGLAVTLGLPAADAAATSTDDRYRAATVGSPLDRLAVPTLADRLLRPAAEPAPGLGRGDVDGARAVTATAAGMRVWVAGTGRPLPLRVAGGPDVPGLLSLAVTTPPASPASVAGDSLVLPTPTATATR